MKDHDQLRRILVAIIQASGVSENEIKSYKKSISLNTARGCFFCMGLEGGYHPREIGQMIDRSRCDTIITANRYRGYYRSGDALVVDIIDKAKQLLYGTDW